jgi:peptidoglycan/xylan/chitin deacetylase (PgdA/CDA1 family)
MRTISLLYHDVVQSGAFDSSGFLTPGANRYKLDAKEFDRHLKAIALQVQRKPATLSDFPPELDDLSLLLTFDDGGAGAHSVIADALEAQGWRGHFFITTDFIDTPGFLTRRQICDLKNRNHVIGSHSCSHPLPISSCSRVQLEKEWSDSVKALEDILGESVKVASIPGGFYSTRVAEAAATARIRVLFTSEPTIKSRQINEMLILGRYGIWRGTSPEVAAGLASGRWDLQFRQFVYWKAKAALKWAGATSYVKLRNRFLGPPERS